MVRHVFLTGKKQVGKSTLLKKVLDRYNGNIGGFFTVRTNEYLKDSYSVHIYNYAEKIIPTAENMLFICGRSKENVAERFDLLGCDIVSKCYGYNLVVMDELGPYEADAALFHKSVLDILNSNASVLGVLQAPAEDFWPDIANNPDVKVVHINENNRDDNNLIDDILSILTNTAI
ncbi:MAG: nucleotide kinase [Firmicutes bacterium]|nr:nucleotide kinase [Bacillota bacterium]